MRYLAFFLTATLLLAAPAALAQEEDHIETDRDSFTPATTTAGEGRLILEAAYSFIDNQDVAETHSFPELITRYGVNDWLELRVGANYEVGGESNSISSGSSGFGDEQPGGIETEANVSYGLKNALTEQHGWMPRSAAILQGITPTSGAETETHLVATYVWGWELAKGCQWDAALRYGDGSFEEDQFDRWAPSTVLKVEVAEQVNAHIEYFGIYTDGREQELSQSYLSPGVHYLLTPNLEIGVRVGWGLGSDAANFFSNAGIGIRL